MPICIIVYYRGYKWTGLRIQWSHHLNNSLPGLATLLPWPLSRFEDQATEASFILVFSSTPSLSLSREATCQLGFWSIPGHIKKLSLLVRRTLTDPAECPIHAYVSKLPTHGHIKISKEVSYDVLQESLESAPSISISHRSCNTIILYQPSSLAPKA